MAKIWQALIMCSQIITFTLCAHAAYHVPLPPPIVCNCSTRGCTVESYQRTWVDRTPCRAAAALYPTSEAELFQAVALASKTRSKIKVVSKGSHSIPKLVCPGGHDGILVSTRDYNSLIRVNLTSNTVTAHAGVLLRDLVHTIAGYGLSLPHSPFWQGVSVAGMISTGAHGSGMWDKGSSPHDYVVGMRIIVLASEDEGYAKVVDLVDGDTDLNAARLSLGVLGAISTVTFQLEPIFKRSVTLEIKADEKLEDEVLEFAKAHEFGVLNWYPASGKILLKLEDRVSANTHGDGANKMAILDEMDVSLLERFRNALEASEETQNMEEVCEQEAEMINLRHSSGDGLVNFGSTFIGYPVVGFNHKMQTAGGCEKEESSPIITPIGIDFNEHHTHGDGIVEEQVIPLGVDDDKLVTCFWNPDVKGSLLFFDTAISIPSSTFKDAIIDIKKLRDINPKAMCTFAYIGGIWIRFLTTSKAYLGESTNSIVFEMTYYRSKEPFTPRLHQDLFEEIEQILLFKFGGKPHWGKNRDMAFEDMNTRTLSLEKFLEVRQRFDPWGLFSSEWTDAILGINISSKGVQTFQDHCALEGLCVCKEDSHCHPTKGYFCRQGHVYKEARVCRYEKHDTSM